MFQANDVPHVPRRAHKETGLIVTAVFGKRELKVAFAIRQHGEAIVGRIDKGATNRSVGNGVDYSTANSGRFLVGQEVLPGSLRQRSGASRKDDRKDENEKKRPAPDGCADASPPKVALDRSVVGSQQESLPAPWLNKGPY